jgi:hypothetical protein
MFGIDDPVVLIIFAVVSAIIAFACYVAAQRPPRGWWIAGGIFAGLFSLSAISALIEIALSPLLAGPGLLAAVLIVLFLTQTNNSPRGPHW